jgi:phosphoribosylaminoimidazole-succinocarboxamide synthase
MAEALIELELDSLPLFWRGKVRHSFDLDDHLLLVATDRISAFDVILPTPIPGKGRLLNRLSMLWFGWAKRFAPNHFVTTDLSTLRLSKDERAKIEGRSMIVRKATRIDIECVVRGYLAGSAWEEYRSAGTIHTEPAPPGLVKGDRLPTPRFTPALKNDSGHDENISRSELCRRVGAELATELEERSMTLYRAGASVAFDAGFLLADTKFEFGFIDNAVSVIDEMLTPDSSRFWDAAEYQPGREPPAYDKQVVRDWLTRSGWDRQPPGPPLPDAVMDETLFRYQEVERRIRATMSDRRESDGDD